MRAKKAKKRVVQPDPVYKSVKLTKFINRTMKDGKKDAARKQVYAALDIVAKKTKRDALEIFEEALEKITPKMEVRSRRVGGAAYQVPMPVRQSRAASLAIRWLIMESNKRSSKEFHSYGEKLAAEMLDAIEEMGGAYQRKLTSHKMADANKAFAHFRW